MGFVLERITTSPIPQRFIGRDTLLFKKEGKSPIVEVKSDEDRPSFDFSISDRLEFRSRDPETPGIIPSDNSSEYNMYSNNPMHKIFINRNGKLKSIKTSKEQVGLKSGDKIRFWDLYNNELEEFKFWTFDSTPRPVSDPRDENWHSPPNFDPYPGLRRRLQASILTSTSF